MENGVTILGNSLVTYWELKLLYIQTMKCYSLLLIRKGRGGEGREVAEIHIIEVEEDSLKKLQKCMILVIQHSGEGNL